MTTQELIIMWLNIIGTVAFAISGAFVAIDKKMDILGISILGLTTAVGGGMIRDLILGNLPPEVFKNPIFALIAIGISLIVFIRKKVAYNYDENKYYQIILFWMDSIGLAAFTVTSISIGYNMGYESIFLLVFLGVVTGVGGGVLRDLFAMETPQIFVQDFYASASIIGAIVTASLMHYAGQINAMIIGAFVIVFLRYLARKFDWNLPKI
ncbi:MAG: trimeric intracellular cation channel family protein [Clostridia bacterium]|nr:trimeric intracellular cation channel family protein [Clostridia bacterium]